MQGGPGPCPHPTSTRPRARPLRSPTFEPPHLPRIPAPSGVAGVYLPLLSARPSQAPRSLGPANLSPCKGAGRSQLPAGPPVLLGPPWPGLAWNQEPTGTGSGAGGWRGCYLPERQLLAAIYFCLKCRRIAGLEPPAQGAWAAAGRRGRWAGRGAHSPSVTSAVHAHTHTHTHACMHTHRARYLAISTCHPPPTSAQLSWGSQQAAVRRLRGQRVPTAGPRLAATSGWGCPSWAAGCPLPQRGHPSQRGGHSPRRAGGGPAPPQRGAQETQPALHPRETDNKQEKT